MKKGILFTLFVFLTTTLFSQLKIKEINKSLALVSENVYASKFEVSNKLYRTFIQSLKDSGKTDLLAEAKIDSTKWTEGMQFNQPYVDYYHVHPAYGEYPVVNISHEGAVLFCAWLTTVYNTDPKRKFNKVIFRLPTEEEWIMAAQAGDTSAAYSSPDHNVKDKNGIPQLNFVRDRDDFMGVASRYNDRADITAPVESYQPNKSGFYNMSGNVSEMLITTGFVKGGGWRDSIENLRIDSRIPDDGKPKPTVGFRYFAEIVEK